MLGLMVWIVWGYPISIPTHSLESEDLKFSELKLIMIAAWTAPCCSVQFHLFVSVWFSICHVMQRRFVGDPKNE
jgi:hypothetical protein